MSCCPSFAPIVPTPVDAKTTEVDDRAADLAFIERVIATTREFPPLGHVSIAYLLGVTKSRVSQIETMAVAKLKRRGRKAEER